MPRDVHRVVLLNISHVGNLPALPGRYSENVRDLQSFVSDQIFRCKSLHSQEGTLRMSGIYSRLFLIKSIRCKSLTPRRALGEPSYCRAESPLAAELELRRSCGGAEQELLKEWKTLQS